MQSSYCGTDKFQSDRSSLRFSLLLEGGIEPNPGPRHPKFPCTVCSKACKTECIACDECNQWVHRTCIGMSTTKFSLLGRSEETWSCPSCASINNSSRIYSVPEADEQDASQSLNYSAHPSMLDSVSDISFPARSSTSTEQSYISSLNNSRDPILTSSPKQVRQSKHQQKSHRILNINFQSLRKKGKLLEAIIIDADPDIILGKETWLDNSIASSEILPNDLGYDIQRRDRPGDPHGGVLIAAKRCYMLSNIHCAEDIELISGTIKLSGNKSLTFVTYYRPPNKTDEMYLTTSNQEISDLKRQCKNSIFLVGGGFNFPDIN